MNLSDLMAPEQGKVLPTKGGDPGKTEDATDTEFAALVSEQSEEQPHANVADGAPAQTEPTAPAPSAGIAVAPKSPAVPDALVAVTTEEATQPKVSPVQILGEDAAARRKTVPSTDGDGDGVSLQRSETALGKSDRAITTDRSPAAKPALTPAPSEAGQTIRPDSGVPVVTDGKPLQTTASAPSIAVEQSALEQRSERKNRGDARIGTLVDGTIATGSAAKGGKAANDTPAVSNALPRTDTGLQAPAPTNTPPITVTTATPRPAPRIAASDDVSRPSVSDDAAIEIKAQDRRIVNITDGAEIVDLARVSPRSGATASQPSVVFGADAPLAPSLTGTTSITQNSTAPADPRLAFPEPRAAAQHVAPQIVNALAARVPGTVIDVTLDPPELGRIEIMLDFAENGVRASLAAERQTTGDLLRRHSDILAEYFENAGFSDVDLSFGDPRGDNSDRPAAGVVLEDPLAKSNADSDGATPTTKRPTAVAVGAGIDILL